ncbi:reverse transcriptase family protein [Granulicoccus sp. GXG6511]|uniref:reverse transcriptase family protein n=1 Tax=Granulicoccus sp. GXG6511 TaxID=3381351 RepID=UPI003D7EE59D
MSQDPVARALARALFSSSWTTPELISRTIGILPHETVSLAHATAIVRELLEIHPTPHQVRARALAPELLGLPTFQQARIGARQAGIPWRPQHWPLSPTTMAARSWDGVPPLPDEAALSAWLGLPPNELAWLADNQHRHRRLPEGPLQPYRATWTSRRAGPPRLLEAPNSLLKRTQRRIATLVRTLGAHDSAYGFVPGRNALAHADRHVGQRRVLTIDLRDFFAHITARRIFGLLFAAGYPEQVAYVLAGLSTTATPIAVLNRMPPGGSDDQRAALRARLREPHLPQGSPSSPAWSNAICFRLDRRLTGLAVRLGGSYSRYADDLTFSGDRLPSLHAITRIIRAEGFTLNPTKTRSLGRGAQQRVTGIVVNNRPNAPRRDYERLKAILHDAAVNGVEQANRDDVLDFAAHLRGRIAWVAQLNPVRGQRLLARYAEIDFG